MEFQFLTGGGFECRDRVHEAFQIMDQLVNNDESELLQSRLNLCHPVDTNSLNDVSQLFDLYLTFITKYFNVEQ